MKKSLKLLNNDALTFTLVPDRFITDYLMSTNGTFVKIYLYLLYRLKAPQVDLCLTDLADSLLLTESDVERALTYFMENGLMSVSLETSSPRNEKAVEVTSLSDSSNFDFSTESESDNVVDVTSTGPSETPSTDFLSATAPTYDAHTLASFLETDQAKQLVFFTEQLLKKSLTSHDLTTLYSFHDWLELPYDVIEYLIEYCVDNNHRHINYIEKVAIDWAKNGINTVPRAKEHLSHYPTDYHKILRAYGVTNRSPIPAEIKLMDTWLKDYNFDLSVIVEACYRTISKINKPEMRYTHKILTAWHQKNLKSLAKIEQYDQTHRPEISPSHTKRQPAVKKAKNNSFTNYVQREVDYAAMGKRALELRLNKESRSL